VAWQTVSETALVLRSVRKTRCPAPLDENMRLSFLLETGNAWMREQGLEIAMHTAARAHESRWLQACE